MIKYLAHIILELQSPLCIASGLENSYSDTQVRRDYNNLPVIPGTSLKGVIRSLASQKASEFLGKDAENGNKGSSLLVSDALLMNSQGKVFSQLNNRVFEDKLLQHFQILPNREHVRMNHFGTAEDQGKFTNAIVHKGSRFLLQIKLEVSESEDEIWEELLSLFSSPDFLLGSQVTNGLGRIAPISILHRKYNLRNPEDLHDFCDFTPYSDIPKGKEFIAKETTSVFELYEQFKFTTNAIHIGTGYGDDEVNASNLIEKNMLWDNEGNFSEAEYQHVIPGSSIKGVLRHRTFYYLTPEYDWRDNTFSLSEFVSQHEEAQKQLESLFGSASENEDGHVGNLIVEDINIPKEQRKETIFQHNSIDSFTGGTIDKALYSEKVFAINKPVTLNIWLSNKSKLKENTLKAFGQAISDLKNGRLAIGGNTTNGNGFLNTVNYG